MFLKQPASNSISLRFSSFVSGYNSSLYLELLSCRSSGLAWFGFQIIAPSHKALTAMSARLFKAISLTGFTAFLPPSTGYYCALNSISVHTSIRFGDNTLVNGFPVRTDSIECTVIVTPPVATRWRTSRNGNFVPKAVI